MAEPITRPGQTFHVPGVRVMRLGELTSAPEDGEEIREIKPDIIRVEVTRVNHGAGQYCITLNNWFDSLPADRKAVPPLGGGREVPDAADNPIWPRFKYNDFRTLDFGMRLRIDMRYWPEPPKDATDPSKVGFTDVESKAHNWTPMIAGPITDMRFSFSSSEGATLMVCGEDDLCCLKKKNPKKIDYWAVSEKDVIKDTIKRSQCPYELKEPPEVPLPTFTDSQARAMAEAHFEGTSYLDYLMKFADRMDCEVFIEFRNLDSPGSGIQLHFTRARSRKPPDNTLHDVHVLMRGKNLIDFTPDLKVVDQYTRVTVTGPDKTSDSSGKAKGVVPEPPAPPPEPLDDELHRDTKRAQQSTTNPPQTNDPPLVSGPEWRRRKFGENEHHEVNQRGLDNERATVMADAIYRKKAREFLKINVSTIGLPRLRAGKHVEIRGMRPPFDGFYYVERSVHTYGPDGLRTQFLARRPGMPFAEDVFNPYGEKVTPA